MVVTSRLRERDGGFRSSICGWLPPWQPPCKGFCEVPMELRSRKQQHVMLLQPTPKAGGGVRGAIPAGAGTPNLIVS